MKKIVSLAIACMLILSCFAINAFAATTFTVNVALVEGDIYAATFNSPVAAQNVKLTFSYGDALVLLDADKAEVTGSSSGTAFNMVIDCELDKQGSKAYEGFAQAYAYRSDPSLLGTGDIFTLYFKKTGSITANPFAFVDSKSAYYGGLTVMGSTSSETYRISKDTATVTWNWEALKDADEKEYEDAVSGASKSITFAGKIKAFEAVENYGVEVNGKKFFGAMVGDTVSSDGTEANFGNTEVAFSDSTTWDGSFQINLTGIKADTTSGSYKYFVNGAYVTDAKTVAIAD